MVVSNIPRVLLNAIEIWEKNETDSLFGYQPAYDRIGEIRH